MMKLRLRAQINSAVPLPGHSAGKRMEAVAAQWVLEKVQLILIFTPLQVPSIRQ